MIQIGIHEPGKWSPRARGSNPANCPTTPIDGAGPRPSPNVQFVEFSISCRFRKSYHSKSPFLRYEPDLFVARVLKQLAVSPKLLTIQKGRSMKRILIVDDEENVREAVRFVLQEEGCVVYEAENSTQALRTITENRPDMIVSDVMMDNGNGFMLREILLENPATASIPVVLMTGAAQGAGAWSSDPSIGYLAKPFTAAELVGVVRDGFKVKEG